MQRYKFCFYANIQPLLNASCITCHPSGSNTNVSLTNYDEVKLALDSNKLLGSIIHDGIASPMPQGGEKWDSCKISIFD